jgi:signal transduction histidine kinase
VVKHAPGSDVRVALAVDASSARLSIVNPCSKPIRHPRGDGLGIAGMRERAALVGGTLDAGADATSWSVVAELPIGAA